MYSDAINENKKINKAMKRLMQLSKLAHEVFFLHKERALALPERGNKGVRYIETIAVYNGIYDLIRYDRKTKRFMVKLCIGKNQGISVERIGVFYDETEYKTFLIKGI